MSTFTFIAVNYNNSHFTIDYINSVNNIIIDKEDEVRIIIVDNASKRQDLMEVKKYSENIGNVSIIESEVNLGYFKGLNLGIAEALKKNRKNIIIGNNDLAFDENFIKKYKKINYDKKVMVIAPNIITRDGRQQNPHVVDRVSEFEKFKTKIYFINYYFAQLVRIFNKQVRKLIKQNRENKTNNYGQMIIKRGIGACYILTENFFEKFNKLDDRVFMWGEEALLSNQVESNGGCTLYDPTIIVHHHESASVNSIQSKQRYYMVKNSYKIYKDYI
ncbi:glycosyltransferase family 2 protein [Clostridium culturomicium]|uniref:glycosyltransferase family 2 protein n=1 Tax=Clostridium culturomicium TaxID=1499683 RepID=UPI00059092E1|nr:glycosyltransferase family 2 protein [Clostridium culturomicium]